MTPKVQLPAEMEDAHYLHETGWPPDVLDAQPASRIHAYLFYKQVMDVRVNGGTLTF